MFNLFKNKLHVKGDCELVQQLKEKQAKLKEIDKNLVDFQSGKNMPNFINFLIALENYGLHLGNYYNCYSGDGSKLKDYFKSNMLYLERALIDVTIEDIDDICNEMKSIKQVQASVEALNLKRAQLTNEITKIKKKLGID